MGQALPLARVPQDDNQLEDRVGGLVGDLVTVPVDADRDAVRDLDQTPLKSSRISLVF